MTPEQISLAIARKMEPKPTPVQLRDAPEGTYKFWKLEQRFTGQTFEFRIVCINHHEPEIAMRLLKDLLERGYCVHQLGSEFAVCWPKDAAYHYLKPTYAMLEDAIALEWMKANGVEANESLKGYKL